MSKTAITVIILLAIAIIIAYLVKQNKKAAAAPAAPNVAITKPSDNTAPPVRATLVPTGTGVKPSNSFA